MAKTKLLAEIESQAGEVGKLFLSLGSKLESANALTDEHWKLLSDSKTAVDKLNQTVSKMKAKIKSWDGSVKLKNIFKNKAKLAEARKTAEVKFGILEKDVAQINSDFSTLTKTMQEIGKMK